MGGIEAHRDLDPPWQDPLTEDWIHADLSEVAVGKKEGRISPDEVTIF